MSRRQWRVQWTDVAKEDLRGLVEYLAERNPDAARRVLAGIEQKAAALKSSPTRGRFVPELLGFQIRTYRELVAPPYRVIYRVARSRVVVLGVFDGRRNLEDVLLDRLLRPS